MKNSIFCEFQRAIYTDSEAPKNIDRELEIIHQRDPEVVDQVLIALCGYSYGSLKKRLLD